MIMNTELKYKGVYSSSPEDEPSYWYSTTSSNPPSESTVNAGNGHIEVHPRDQVILGY
jgi:hypothetical protein